MTLRNIELHQENFTKGGQMILTEVRLAYEYKDRKRTDKVIGLKVTVVLEKNSYDTLTVTVANPVDTLSVLLEKAEAPVYVDFEGFTARIYTIDGRSDVSAKADSVHVVTADLLEID